MTTTTVKLSANATGINVIMYVWDFGDTHFYTGNANAYHRYDDNKNYTITLTVVDNESKVYQCNKTIFIYDTPPVADFSWDKQHPNPKDIIHFTDSSHDPDGNIVAYHWNISGKIVDIPNPTHAFVDAGIFNITLTVTDDDGGNASITKRITVSNNKPPSAVFTVSSTTVTVGDEIKFNDNSVDPDGSIASWQWHFGDGTTSPERNPVHIFKKSGEYTVNLTVTDDDGAISSYLVKMQVDKSGDTPAFGLIIMIAAICITYFYKHKRDIET